MSACPCPAAEARLDQRRRASPAQSFGQIRSICVTGSPQLPETNCPFWMIADDSSPISASIGRRDVVVVLQTRVPSGSAANAGAAKAAKATQEIKIRFIVSLLVQDASASFSLMFACNAIREVTAIVATGFRSWLKFSYTSRFDYAMRVLLRARIHVLLSRANDLGFRAKKLFGAGLYRSAEYIARVLKGCSTSESRKQAIVFVNLKTGKAAGS